MTPANQNQKRPEGMGCAFWACIGAVVTLLVWVVMTIGGVGI